MIWEKTFAWKKKKKKKKKRVLDPLKPAPASTMKISGARHALHTTAETGRRHNCAAIATEGATLQWPSNRTGGRRLV